MALVVKDRVKESTETDGTGVLSLAGAATGFQTFVAAIGDGNTTYYAIEDADGSAWEVGIGTITDASPDTLARTTILASSNSGSAISLTVGNHTVFGTYPAGKAVHLDASGDLSHTVDISTDTNLAAGTGITLAGDTLNVDAAQTQITSVGTIATGVWQGTTVAVAYGGTGATSLDNLLDFDQLADVSFGGTNLTRTLLINAGPGGTPSHGTLAGDCSDNIGIGYLSLSNITQTLGGNVAIGLGCLQYNTSGGINVAIGSAALNNATTAHNNIAIGDTSGFWQNGWNNISIGDRSMYGSDGNTISFFNVAVGFQTLVSVTDGGNNVAIGRDVLKDSTGGDNNVAIGLSAMQDGTDSGMHSNIALGTYALKGTSLSGAYQFNIGIGLRAGDGITTGDKNIFLGYLVGRAVTSESSMLYIANQAENANGTLIKGDMANKFLAIGKADVTLSTEDSTLQVYPDGTNDTAYFAKMPASHTGDLIRIENSSGTEIFKVDKDGVIPVPYTTITGDTTVTTANVAVFANATSGAIDVTLYAATSNGGKTLTIKKTDSSSNTVDILRAGSETIDGETSFTLTVQNESITLMSDNSNWFIV
jgi:hypothetical protein